MFFIDAGTRRVKQSGSLRACCSSNCARSPSLAPRLLSRVSPALSRRTARNIASRLTIFASSSQPSYSSEDSIFDIKAYLSAKENDAKKARTYRALATTFFVIGVIRLVYSQALQVSPAVAGTPIAGLNITLAIIHFIAAIAANCLSDAAPQDRLSSDICKRLNFGLFAWGAATVAVYFTSKVALDIILIPLYFFTASYMASVLFPIIFSSKEGLSFSPPPSTGHHFIGRNLYGSAAAISPIFAITVGYNICKPGVLTFSWMVTSLDSLSSHAISLLGAGALLVHQVLVILQEAAHHGRLGSSTIRNLNWGVAILCGSIINLVVTGAQLRIIRWPLPVEAPTFLKSIILDIFPYFSAEGFAQMLDGLPEFALLITMILGCFSLYAAIAGKDK